MNTNVKFINCKNMKEEVKKSIGLFSEETLDSIAMAELMGGDTNTYCNGGNCVP